MTVLEEGQDGFRDAFHPGFEADGERGCAFGGEDGQDTHGDEPQQQDVTT